MSKRVLDPQHAVYEDLMAFIGITDEEVLKRTRNWSIEGAYDKATTVTIELIVKPYRIVNGEVLTEYKRYKVVEDDGSES